MTHSSRLARYGVAVLVIGLMALVKVLMDPLSDQQLTPFLLFFAAVMVSALFGGLGPGLLTTFLAAVVSVYFFFPPAGKLFLQDAGQVLRLFIFLIEGLAICVLSAMLKRARRRSEVGLERLRESESRLRTIVETEPECVKVLDKDGRLLEMNPAGLAMVEADSLEQVRGKPVYDVVVPEYRADFVALTEKVLRGGSGMLEYEIVGLKGTRCWLETHAVPLRDTGGEISGLLGITRDVTERKKAEQALLQSERLYRTVIEQATENIFLVDMESGYIVESNPAFREALGYTEDELGRMRLYAIVADDRDSVERNMQLILEERRSFLGQRRYRRKNGTYLDVEASASLILRDGRETLCVVAHDVTERARAQQLLEERLATLSRVAARLTLDLPVQDTLDATAENIVNVSTAVACAVILVDEATGYLRIEGSYGLPEGFKASKESVWQEGAVRSPTMEAIRTRQPKLVSRMRQRMLENPLYAPVHHSVREVAWDTVFIVPLIFRHQALGAIYFSYLEGQQPGEAERIFLAAVADQAAVAVENARLYAEARGKVVLKRLMLLCLSSRRIRGFS